MPRLRFVKKLGVWWEVVAGGYCTCGAWRRGEPTDGNPLYCWYCLGWDYTLAGPLNTEPRRLP